MQPETTPENFFLDPAGRPEPPRPAASAQRGLAILQVVLLIELGGGLLSGAVLAAMMSPGSAHSATAVLSMFLSAWQLLFIGTTVAELIALKALAGAPPAAGVAGLARSTLGLRAAGLGLTLLTSAMYYFWHGRIGSMEVWEVHRYIGYVETAIGFAGTVLLVELLLRLRRFAAPTDLQLAENESLVRAGILAALVARILVNYLSYTLGRLWFASGPTDHWLGFAVRVPFTLLFYGLLLWLVQTAATALRDWTPATAAAVDPLVAPALDTSAAGYRNMLFGGLWAVGGIAMSVLTYQNAHELGGRYVVAYGAIFAGIVQFIRGLTQLSRQK